MLFRQNYVSFTGELFVSFARIFTYRSPLAPPPIASAALTQAYSCTVIYAGGFLPLGLLCHAGKFATTHCTHLSGTLPRPLQVGQSSLLLYSAKYRIYSLYRLPAALKWGKFSSRAWLYSCAFTVTALGIHA